MHKRHLDQQACYDDPLGLIAEALSLYDQMMLSLGEEIAYADHSSAHVGALRTLMDLVGRRLNLLIEVGVMPRNLGDYADFPSLREMIVQMAEVIEKHDLPVEVVNDMLAVVEQADRRANTRDLRGTRVGRNG
jgi:hypothetical protein